VAGFPNHQLSGIVSRMRHSIWGATIATALLIGTTACGSSHTAGPTTPTLPTTQPATTQPATTAPTAVGAVVNLPDGTRVQIKNRVTKAGDTLIRAQLWAGAAPVTFGGGGFSLQLPDGTLAEQDGSPDGLIEPGSVVPPGHTLAGLVAWTGTPKHGTIRYTLDGQATPSAEWAW